MRNRYEYNCHPHETSHQAASGADFQSASERVRLGPLDAHWRVRTKDNSERKSSVGHGCGVGHESSRSNASQAKGFAGGSGQPAELFRNPVLADFKAAMDGIHRPQIHKSALAWRQAEPQSSRQRHDGVPADCLSAPADSPPLAR